MQFFYHDSRFSRVARCLLWLFPFPATLHPESEMVHPNVIRNMIMRKKKEIPEPSNKNAALELSGISSKYVRRVCGGNTGQPVQPVGCLPSQDDDATTRQRSTSPWQRSTSPGSLDACVATVACLIRSCELFSSAFGDGAYLNNQLNEPCWYVLAPCLLICKRHQHHGLYM